MTLKRTTPNTTSHPSGVGEATYAGLVSTEIGEVGKRIICELGSVAGTATAITASVVGADALTALAAPMAFWFTPASNASSAATIAIDGLAAVDLVDAAGNAISENGLIAGRRYLLAFDGTNMRVHPSGVRNIVEDTTPQLGGTLDTNAKQIRWSKGADVASAGALTLGDDGNYFDITGTTAITSIGTKAVGTVVKLHFDDVLTLTHHATDLILPGAANITTAAGDEAEFVEYATGDWRCTGYVKASGYPVAVTPGSTTVVGGFEKATDAETRSATADKAITADLIETASALVALTDAATVAVDWDAGIAFSLTVTTNRAIGNPTNGQPGTFRVITVQGNDATDRTITFGTNFEGDIPTITDCDSTTWYDIYIRCITASHFTATAHKSNKP